MTSIKSAVLGDQYGEQIARFLQVDFPFPPRDEREILEALTVVFSGTSQLRYGPLPSPENLVAIRAVLRERIAQQEPIPMLIPWGSKKPDNHLSVDISEIGALKTLHCFGQQVRSVYAPGITAVLRIEDVGGRWLFRDEGVLGMDSQDRYVNDLSKLLRITGLSAPSGFVHPVPESIMMDAEEYIKLCDRLTPIFQRYIEESDLYGTEHYTELRSWSDLSMEGWKGSIPVEQRDFYRQRYGRHYHSDPRMATVKLAEYFAGSLARYRMRGTGALSSWGKNFIQLNFAQPAPGTPAAIGDRRIYARTLPARFARTHIPAWRAKGYVLIENDRVTPKLTSPHDLPEGLTECALVFENDDETVTVRADYLLA